MHQLSKSEWSIINCLWQSSYPLTVSEIYDNLYPKLCMSKNCIRTLLSRLLKKEAVGVCKQTRPYHYYALEDKNTLSLIEAHHFLDKCFQGSIVQCISTLITLQMISEEDCQLMFSIIKKYKEEMNYEK